MLLVGDIGGTKTDLAIISSMKEIRKPVAEATFPSARYSSLEAVVREFLAQSGGYQVERACFGVAGPVIGGKANITNLPWIIDDTVLSENLKLSSVRLLNDLEAIAHAVPFLGPDDLHTLNAGQPALGGTLAVIAPGTGLGEAYLTWDGEGYTTHTSEGGHCDFAPINAAQLEMLRYLQTRLDHVSYERVCSGLGLPNIYAYLKDSGFASEPPWLAEQLTGASDQTPIIVKAAQDKESPSALCIATVNTFVSILGAESGNLALKVLATGGVYIGGGIPPRILPFLENQQFMQSFLHKGRFSDLLIHIPVHVILTPKLGRLGAAYHGFEPKAH